MCTYSCTISGCGPPTAFPDQSASTGDNLCGFMVVMWGMRESESEMGKRLASMAHPLGAISTSTDSTLRLAAGINKEEYQVVSFTPALPSISSAAAAGGGGAVDGTPEVAMVKLFKQLDKVTLGKVTL